MIHKDKVTVIHNENILSLQRLNQVHRVQI